MQRKTKHSGVRVRHRRKCNSARGGACTCKPAYEAWAYSRRDGRKIRRTFPSLAAAKGWRADAQVALRKRTMRAPTRVTVRDAWVAWHAGASDGSITNRSGNPYKPSAVRSYERAWRLRLDR